MTTKPRTKGEAAASDTKVQPAGAGSRWRQVQAEALTAMSDEEWATYDAAAAEEEMKLELAELVYNARQAAGLSQSALATRAGPDVVVDSATQLLTALTAD